MKHCYGYESKSACVSYRNVAIKDGLEGVRWIDASGKLN